MIIVNSFSIISDLYKKNKSKLLVRLNMGFLLGAFFAPILVSGILFFNIGWRYLFLTVALINLIIFQNDL